MSDEREGAGSAGDDTDTADDSEGRGSTAVAARSQQPRGKRSQRALTDDAADSKAVSKNGSAKKTAKKGESSRTNPFVYVATFLKQVVAELRKVIWPNRKEMITYTSVVLFFLVFMVALIGGVDVGWAKLVTLVFG